MESESSLLSSKQPSSFAYAKPDESSPFLALFL